MPVILYTRTYSVHVYTGGVLSPTVVSVFMEQGYWRKSGVLAEALAQVKGARPRVYLYLDIHTPYSVRYGILCRY